MQRVFLFFLFFFFFSAGDERCTMAEGDNKLVGERRGL